MVIKKNRKKDRKAEFSASTIPDQKIVRKPAVAGSFYPKDSHKLNSKLTDLLNQASLLSKAGRLKILIVPHAGIDYSGRVAAYGFKQIEGKNYKKIILLGVSHRAYFDHVAVDSSRSWETPLGGVDVDQTLVSSILSEDKNIVSDISPHEEEHSLEMELIFLQKVLLEFKIVPILVSQPSNQTIDYLAQKIEENLNYQTLLVVSSDLSHYPTWRTANELDAQTIEAIISAKRDLFERTIEDIESKNYSNLATAVCGYQPLRVALQVAENLQLKNFKKIKYENSGDVAGDKDRVVGYTAIGIWDK